MNKFLLLSSLLVLPAAIAPLAPEAPAQDAARSEVEALITGFLGAAAEADAEAYFAALDEDAILIGTDVGERWTTAEMRTLIGPVFARGERRKSVPSETHVTVAEGGRTAWFDQRLESERWGEMRGTGVARRDGERWKIVQYVWSFPVPNELVPELSERFREVRSR
jgi:ketosteroid isomerase-like protein